MKLLTRIPEEGERVWWQHRNAEYGSVARILATDHPWGMIHVLVELSGQETELLATRCELFELGIA